METTTTSADLSELLKVEETGGDIEVKTERGYTIKNQYMTRNKIAEAQAPIQTQVLILAPLMMNK